MKVLNVHSEKHRTMYETIFYTSLKFVEPEATVEKIEAPQFSETAVYGDQGWRQQMSFKARIVRAMIHHGEPFLYADTDIVFLKPFLDDLKERMQGYDAVFQKSGRLENPCCAGFAAYSSSPACVGLLEKTIEIMGAGNTVGDQHALNEAIRQTSGFRYALLPDDYWHVGLQPDTPRVWQKGMPLAVPVDTRMAHATWVQGDNKWHFFKKVGM